VLLIDSPFRVIFPLTSPAETECHATFVPNLTRFKVTIPAVHRHIGGVSSFIVSKRETQQAIKYSWQLYTL